MIRSLPLCTVLIVYTDVPTLTCSFRKPCNAAAKSCTIMILDHIQLPLLRSPFLTAIL